MKQFEFCVCLLLLLFTVGCADQPAGIPVATPASPTSSPDADPCASQNLPAAVQPLNDMMQEFEDASQRAPTTPSEQLPRLISDLQRVRRDAEDAPVPSCLTTLKAHLLNHMNLTIQTLLSLVGGADQEELTRGLEMARQERDRYSLEIVRLLGVTLAPVTATP